MYMSMEMIEYLQNVVVPDAGRMDVMWYQSMVLNVSDQEVVTHHDSHPWILQSYWDDEIQVDDYATKDTVGKVP